MSGMALMMGWGRMTLVPNALQMQGGAQQYRSQQRHRMKDVMDAERCHAQHMKLSCRAALHNILT